jgi:signal transduction histidine kinase
MRIVENAVGFAEIDARKRQIDIELSIPDPVPDVIADPILIEQVLLNLLKNGIEAMEHSEHHVLQLVITQQESLLEMAVIDRGHGLKDPERLFEPFYSTKSEGLGMGLNICRTIIESHHGRLWAVGNPEGGTIFRFSLPCAAPDVADTLDNKLEIPE